MQDWLCERNVCTARRAEYHGQLSGQKAGNLPETWEGRHPGPPRGSADHLERTGGPDNRGTIFNNKCSLKLISWKLVHMFLLKFTY